MPKVLALLLAGVVALAACGAPAPTTPEPAVIGPAGTPGPPDPTNVPGASPVVEAGVLVTYETRGGECPNGPCGMKAVIRMDGSIERSDGVGRQLDGASVDRVTAAIEKADWGAILAIPFTGECPVNYDGQEQVYTFNVKGQAVVVASCTTQFDPASDPFVAVQVALFGTEG